MNAASSFIPASVTNAEQITKTTTAFELSDNLGTEGGTAAVVGTRYHMADSYQAMLDRKTFKLRKYPATHNGKKDGKSVFLTEAELERKRKAQPFTFPAQMLLDPLAGPDQIFEVDKIKRWEIRPRTLAVYILVDPAKGPGHKEVGGERDRTAMAVIGMDTARNFYLLDGYRHRMSLGERWEALRNLHRRWSSTIGVLTVVVGYEQYGMLSDVEFFERMMAIEKEYITIEVVPRKRKDIPKGSSQGQGSKEDRIARLVPDLVKGRFQLPYTVWHETQPVATWGVKDGSLHYPKQEGPTALQRQAIERGLSDTVCSAIKRINEDRAVYDLTCAFVEEAMFFPYGSHDDLLDACSRVYDLEPTPPTTIQQVDVEPDEYIDGI